MAWYSSWIPGLPSFNFSVPTGLQGRFISFLLKKSLGHLLKPGQLDYRQIDSQIGSGYVQINDLELNSEAINHYLRGVPLILQDGTISSVKVRIPWPNPLASTLGFSLKSLHLNFCVAPDVGEIPFAEETNLADSVASMADSFVQEQLSSTEGTTLWRSFHQDHGGQLETEHVIPGGLEPLPSDGPTTLQQDAEPVGVSVFANLIERLLARFEFDAQDIRITLVHPDNMSLTLSLKDIRYLTNGQNDFRDGTTNNPTGDTRTLSVDGISLSSRNLSSKAKTAFPRNVDSPCEISSANTSRPQSRSSTSSLDEEARFDMTQSLAMLPPRRISPSSSVSSSMYESALSAASLSGLDDRATELEHPHPGPASVVISESFEEVVMTFGSQPVSLQITSRTIPKSDIGYVTDLQAPLDERLDINLSMGVVTIALQPWQVLGLLGLVNEMKEGPGNASSSKSSGSIPQISAKAEIRGCVVLLLSPSTKQSSLQERMAEFFEHPLLPPPLDNSYTRIYLDSLSSTVSFVPTTPSGTGTTLSLSEAQFAIADISVFFFTKDPDDPISPVSIFPVLITDPYLPTQYASSDHAFNPQPFPALPVFEALDWTHENTRSFGTRISQWRCHTSKSRTHNQLNPVSAINDSPAAPSSFPALRLGLNPMGLPNDVSTQTIGDLRIQLAPLHIRFDLGFILQPAGPLAFYEEISLHDLPISDSMSISSGTTVDKNMVGAIHEEQDDVRLKARKSPVSRRSVNFSFIRLSIRCPPPARLNDRSGTLIFDLRDMNMTSNPENNAPTTRFANHGDFSDSNSDFPRGATLYDITFRRMILACTLVNQSTATSLVSVAPLMEEKESQGFSPRSILLPQIRINRPHLSVSKGAPALALIIDLQSMHVNLGKVWIDTLQYWADDVTQLMERVTGPKGEPDSAHLSRNPSIIGSRFLAKSKNSATLGANRTESDETVFQISLKETFACITVPRTDTDNAHIRPFLVKASDLDILVELNAEHKQQTILTMGMMNLTIDDTSANGELRRFLSSTPPYSLTTAPPQILKLSLTTATELGNKETQIKLTMSGFTYTFYPDIHWIADLVTFSKNPPGTFETVIPSDRTRISVKVAGGSVKLLAPTYPGSMVTHIQDLEFSTDVVGDSRDSSFHINAAGITLLAIDDFRQQNNHPERNRHRGALMWMGMGYATIAEFIELDTTIVKQISGYPSWKIVADRAVVRMHLCADTLVAVSAFSQDLGSLFNNPEQNPEPSTNRPVVEEAEMMHSVEDLAFKRVPEVGPAPDMIFDDLPTNLDYLDESFGAAAGLRELVDEDLDQFNNDAMIVHNTAEDANIVSLIGGETVKVFDRDGLDMVEGYYLSIPPDKSKGTIQSSDAVISVRVIDAAFKLFLYDGYDWEKTRRTIEEEVKEMRKRLAKIRQLVASGQVQEPLIEDTSTLLFNSVHIGLEQDEDALEEPSALLAAIDEELQDDQDTASQSSWQSLRSPSSNKPRTRSPRVHGKRLTRSKSPSIEFSLEGLYTEFDQYGVDDPLVSRTFVTVRDLEILDHIKTSTWKKFLTDLRSDSRGNVRETESNMVRIELQGIRPVSGNSAEEVRLRAKILPLRLYVDQDAVDFLKKFFSFKESSSASPSDENSNQGETYIQMGEIFPIDLKLDYKPRRVDYRALKEGRTIELMNFFHFDGAEMTLRHITLAGVTGWPKFFEMLNDMWTPDVKATQLVEVISGVAPIRSVVNVGSGVADLILLPIAQYKKDGRIVRGVQKGATAFVKSTAIEAIKMGAKLATGTQVILEQAEGLLGGQFSTPVTAEPVQVSYGDEAAFEDEDEDGTSDLISKYAQQPVDLREGVQSAYQSLQRNFNSAAQTILAVPMEVYERSGNEGPVRSVIRAVPIAVLKPMIGASEAVSKTLLGLQNTLDPNIRHENEAKYKLR